MHETYLDDERFLFDIYKELLMNGSFQQMLSKGKKNVSIKDVKREISLPSGVKSLFD